VSIGSKLKLKVYEKLGTAFTIIRDSGNVTGEYLDYEINKQVTKPFIREYFLEAEMAYDTVAVVGDVIQFDDSRTFLVMNKTPDHFKNVPIKYECVFYKANVSGEVLRPSGESWSSQTYHKEQQWETVKENCYALETEALFGHDLDADQELGMLNLKEDELYIPSSVNIQVNDRYQPVSGEYYRVEVVKKRRFDGVDVCELGEDHR